ncbi:MAG: hypothetical protein Q4G35_14250, partial [Propionibacteriaceae bacterium]|nr:hypothetical protein [Propionibacteriaceae bacterium]
MNSRGSVSTRARLNRGLNRLTEPTLVTVAAGAGYGKSTLLTTWQLTHPRVVLIPLDQTYNDPVELSLLLIERIGRVVPEVRALVADAQAPDADWYRDLFPRLIAAL